MDADLYFYVLIVKNHIVTFYQAVFHGQYGIYARFLISGGSAAFVDLAILYVLTDVVGLWYLHSSILAFLVAFGVSFTLQKFWAFQDTRATARIVGVQGSVYFVFACCNLALNTLLMYVFVEMFQWWHMAGQIVAGAAVACVSFFVYRHVIFKVGASHTS
ncbi:MAG: GtrA family protein [Methylomonas sp.]|nr:GtrA family protein [Methylomonas sp.]